jgi:hypothetical protein
MPRVDPHIAYCLEAFETLSARRGYTQHVPLPISLVEIVAYCQLYRLSRSESLALQRRIDKIDAIWLKLNMPKEQPKPAKTR